jgi:hypothetical protein
MDEEKKHERKLTQDSFTVVHVKESLSTEHLKNGLGQKNFTTSHLSNKLNGQAKSQSPDACLGNGGQGGTHDQSQQGGSPKKG